jgi:hypothetical protein
MGDYFLFGLFIIKKITKPVFFFKKPKPNRNWFRSTGFGSIILGKKSFQTDLTWFFSVCLGFFPVWHGFFGLARFFFGLARFFFDFGSVQFGFFGFRLINQNQTEPNRTDQFFQNSNRFNLFFFTVRFFRLFFSNFLSLIGFSGFCLPLVFNVAKFKR